MTASSELRPRTVGEILDASFTLYRRRFGALLLVATVFSLPALVGAFLLADGADAAFSMAASEFRDYWGALKSAKGRINDDVLQSAQRFLDSSQRAQIFLYLSALAQAVARGGVCIAATTITWAAVRGEPTPGGWALVRGALPRVVAATIVWGVLAVVGTFCGVTVIVPVLAHAVLAPAWAVLALERGPMEDRVGRWRSAPARVVVMPIAAAMDGMARALRLSTDARTLARSTFVVLCVLTFVSSLVMVISVVGALLWKSFGAFYVLQHYAEVVLLPVIGISCALWYLDLRVRREGMDLAGGAA